MADLLGNGGSCWRRLVFCLCCMEPGRVEERLSGEGRTQQYQKGSPAETREQQERVTKDEGNQQRGRPKTRQLDLSRMRQAGNGRNSEGRACSGCPGETRSRRSEGIPQPQWAPGGTFLFSEAASLSCRPAVFLLSHGSIPLGPLNGAGQSLASPFAGGRVSEGLGL